jgi:hypothetical protein
MEFVRSFFLIYIQKMWVTIYCGRKNRNDYYILPRDFQLVEMTAGVVLRNYNFV